MKGALTKTRDAGSKLWGGMKSGASKLGDYGSKAASAAKDIGKTTAAWVAQKAALLAAKAQQLALTVAQKAAAIAQWALNTAMSANPVTLIVLGIVALVAVLVLAYKKVGWFRAGVDAAFGFVKRIVMGAVDFIRNNWKTLLAILTGPIGLAVLLITSHWDKIKHGFTVVKDWIRDRVSDIVGFVTGIGGRIRSAASRMWDGIKSSARTVRDYVKDRVSNIVGFVRGIPDRLKTIGSRLKDALLSPFKSAFKLIAKGWNATLGGFSVSIPDIPGLPGRGKSFTIPSMDESALDKFHTGGVVPGGRRDEVPILALGQERVLTAAQNRAYERWLSTGDSPSGRRGGAGMHIENATFGDNARRTVRDLNLWSMSNAAAVLSS